MTEQTIQLDETTKRAVAEAIVEQSHPGYSRTGYYYTDGHEVWFAESTRPWNPWPDNRTVVEVSVFVAEKNLILSPVPETYDDWRAHEEFQAWEAAYLAEGEDDAYNRLSGVLEWAYVNRPAEVEAFEKQYEQDVIDFCLIEMDDEYTITEEDWELGHAR